MKQFLKNLSKLGKPFLIGVLFVLPTSAFAQFSLTTTYAGGNGQAGNMFDVVALNTVTITNFDVNIDPGTWNMEIYVITGGGTYINDVSNPAAWTLVGSANGIVSNGENIPTPCPIPVNVTIPAGNTQGFYVTVTNGTSINYTNGTTTGAVFVQDSNIQVLEGHGNPYPFSTTNYNPRNWNGTIHYTAGDLGVSATESELQGATDSNVTFNLTASNFTTAADDYNISFSGNTWASQALIGGNPVTTTGSIAGGGSGNFEVEVTIPSTANNGDFDNLTVTLTSVANPNKTANINLTTTVVNYAVEVQTDLYGSGDSGTNLIYDVKVKNIGSLDDDFNISFAGNSWASQALVSGNPATNTGTILAGDSITVQIEITVPVGAATNDFDGANVNFTSVGDAAVSDISVINSWAIDPNAPQPEFAEILQYEFNATNPASAGTNVAVPGFGSSNATVIGLALEQGQHGTGLAGTGANSNVEYLDTGWITSLNGSWTISFWIDLTSVGTNTSADYIFGDDTAGSFRCFTNGLVGQGGLLLRNAATGWNDIDIPAGVLSAQTGVVSFVHDSENMKLRSYFNDTMVNEVDAPLGLTISGTSNFKIGGYANVAGLPVGAVIDNFKFYNKAIEPGLRLEQLLETDVHDQGYDLWVEASDFAPGIDPASVSVHWKLSTDTNYNTISTTPSIGELYIAQIPATNAFDVNVEYYASATDIDGNTSYFPYNPNTGQGNPYNFDVRLIQPGTLTADPISPGVIPLSWKVGGDNSITLRHDDGSSEFQSVLPNTPPGLNSPAAITFANFFDIASTSINGNAQVTSVDFYVASGAINTSEVKVNIYENANGVPGNIIASSAPAAQGNGGTWVNVNFVDPVTGIGTDIGNGVFFVGIEQTTNSQMSLGGDKTLNAPYNFNVNTHFFKGAGNWTAIEMVSLYGQVIPMIRCNVNEIPVAALTSLQSDEIFQAKKSVKSPFNAQRKMEAKRKSIAFAKGSVQVNKIVSNKGGNQVFTTPTWAVSEYRLYRFDGVANSATDVVANGTIIYNGTNLTFDDNNVVDGQNYSYAVSTVYDVNSTNLESDPSNLVVATPFIVGIEEEENVVVPLEYSVSQNFPNPFNPTTKINYTLKVNESVKLVVYNSLGQEVKTLVNESQKAGIQYTAAWDGTDRNGKTVASGVYYYKIKTNSGFEMTKKATFLK